MSRKSGINVVNPVMVLCQVMAVATLERCYNNPKVFTGVVKIRKGETVRLISMATNIDAVKAVFSYFVSNVRRYTVQY